MATLYRVLRSWDWNTDAEPKFELNIAEVTENEKTYNISAEDIDVFGHNKRLNKADMEALGIGTSPKEAFELQEKELKEDVANLEAELAKAKAILNGFKAFANQLQPV